MYLERVSSPARRVRRRWGDFRNCSRGPCFRFALLHESCFACRTLRTVRGFLASKCCIFGPLKTSLIKADSRRGGPLVCFAIFTVLSYRIQVLLLIPLFGPVITWSAHRSTWALQNLRTSAFSPTCSEHVNGTFFGILWVDSFRIHKIVYTKGCTIWIK